MDAVGREMAMSKKIRLATAWLAGCSGCHMSLLDLHEELIGLFDAVELVFSPLADVKEFPAEVDITLVEGAVANLDNLELAEIIRSNSRLVISFGDCAVTGNVTSLRNQIPVEDLLSAVYREGAASLPGSGDAEGIVPKLLPRVLPLHQVVKVDAYLPGCPPSPQRISAAINALLAGELPKLPPDMRTFG